MPVGQQQCIESGGTTLHLSYAAPRVFGTALLVRIIQVVGQQCAYCASVVDVVVGLTAEQQTHR